METAPQFYFFTERRHQQWVEAQKSDRVQLDHSSIEFSENFLRKIGEDAKGTVGCVALDVFGNLVAGTSTGM
jgi:beta-aspartyl-peptidase (threonine type)